MKKFLAILTTGVLLIAGTTTATAYQGEGEGEWHTWEVQGNYGPNWDQDYWQAFDQPQVHLGKGQLTPACETWAQVDFYPYAAQKHGKSIADVIADGLLHEGEDHHLTGHADGKWYFLYGGPCAEPEPTPEVKPKSSPEPKAPPAVPVEAEATFTG